MVSKLDLIRLSERQPLRSHITLLDLPRASPPARARPEEKAAAPCRETGDQEPSDQRRVIHS